MSKRKRECAQYDGNPVNQRPRDDNHFILNRPVVHINWQQRRARAHAVRQRRAAALDPNQRQGLSFYMDIEESRLVQLYTQYVVARGGLSVDWKMFYMLRAFSKRNMMRLLPLRHIRHYRDLQRMMRAERRYNMLMPSRGALFAARQPVEPRCHAEAACAE